MPFVLPNSADKPDMGIDDDPIERELTLNRFRRLIMELLRGGTRRTTFQAWEVDILLDLADCGVNASQSGRVLRQYMRAGGRQLETGPGPPMKFSEFLQTRRTRRPATE